MAETLAEIARRTDAATAQARAELVQAVRDAARRGESQAEIAAQIGRSQPEVSRLLKFHGTSPLARKLRRHSNAIRRLVAEAGGRHVRVFGSVAIGQDATDSDIDLLFTMGPPLSLMQLVELELRISEVVGANVDLVPDSSLRPAFRDRILAEAVPL